MAMPFYLQIHIGVTVLIQMWKSRQEEINSDVRWKGMGTEERKELGCLSCMQHAHI